MTKNKIFIVSTEFPALTGGTPARNFNLINQIAKNKFSVSLFSVFDKKSEPFLNSTKKKLNIPIYTKKKISFNLFKKIYISIIKRVVPYMEEFNDLDFKTFILKKIEEEKPSILQLEQLNAYFMMKDHIPYLKDKGIKIILDAHNIEEIALKGAISSFGFIKRNVAMRILPNLKKIEKEAFEYVDLIFACSDYDKNIIARIVSSSKVVVIPNGADISYFTLEKKPKKQSLIFMGGCNYPPNEEALKFYFSRIHKEIKKIYNIKIYVLCGKPPNWLSILAKTDKSIILPGFVPDVRQYIHKASIGICPIISGSGTRLKILEYMSCGKPVISTSKGAEGIQVEDKKNIIIADTVSTFIEAVNLLFTNANIFDRYSKEARKLIELEYDWDIVGKKLQNIYKHI